MSSGGLDPVSWTSPGRSARRRFTDEFKAGVVRLVLEEGKTVVPKAELEGLFVEELERLQPTTGYMRLLKRSVLHIWHKRRARALSGFGSQP